MLDAGKKLFQQFKVIQNVIRNIYDRIMDEVNITVQDVLQEMNRNLQDFDNTWVAYEQIYVLELMLIESDARRFITEAIDTEKELTQLEIREKSKGRLVVDTPDYNAERSKLIQVLGKINSVANQEGMGRDDLANAILLAAEGILRRVSPHQSKAVRVLAERIKKSFTDFRGLLKKYEQNIEVVDPQLKNNNELVEILVEFENTWTQGLTYFLDNKKCRQLIHFSSVVEATAEKHKAFSEQLETREAEIFFIIPSLLILKSLEGDDKDICSFFNPDMFDGQTEQGRKYQLLRRNYEAGRKLMRSSFDYYNLIERCILEVPLTELQKQQEKDCGVETKVIREIKGLAMCLSRFKPADWNRFLDVAIK